MPIKHCRLSPLQPVAARPPRALRSITFLSWSDFIRRLPATRATVERWYATGKLKVHIFQPQGPGGRKYVAVEEAERVIQEWSFGKLAVSTPASGTTSNVRSLG